MATQGRYRPDWTIGTLTLVEGEKEFTTTGSALEVAAIQPGDSIITASGLTLIIESITGQNSGTLMQPCSMLAAGTDLLLRIRYQPEGSRLAGMAASLFQMLGGGTLYSLGELVGDEGQFLRFLAPGVLEAIEGGNLNSLLELEKIDNLTVLSALAAVRQIVQTDATGKLKSVVLEANKVLVTDENGDVKPIKLDTLGRVLLALATGTTAQYIQGDGTLQAKTGLPVSTATQTALNGKLSLAGGGTIIGALGVQDARITNYSNFTNVHQYSPGVYTSLGSGIWFTMVVEHNPGSYYQGILQLGYPSSKKNWLLSNTGAFTAVGSINGAAKNFLIDHPTDPDNYDLRHCSTEAPEMLVEYRGTARLVNGRVTVDVEEQYGVKPGTFDALWTDAWVTALQNQDGFDRLRPSRLSGSTFEIFCENESSNDLVTWVVMARRNDPYVRWEGCDFTDAEGKLIIEPAKETA